MKTLHKIALAVFLCGAQYPLGAAGSTADWQKYYGRSWESPEQQVQYWRQTFQDWPVEGPTPDFSGLAMERFKPVPAPGVHPRLLFNPEEVPDLRRRVKETREGQTAMEVIRKHLRMLTDEEWASTGYQDLIAGRKPADFEKWTERGKGGVIPRNWMGILLEQEAFRCLIDDDAEGGRRVGAALATYASILEPLIVTSREKGRSAAMNSLPEDIRKELPIQEYGPVMKELPGPVYQGQMSLGLAYDFAYNYMMDDQRSQVRSLLAASTRDLRTFGMGITGLLQGNWQPFHWQGAVNALAIEGEEGSDPRVVKAFIQAVDTYAHYFFTRAGSPTEGLGKGTLGTWAFPLAAKRGGWGIAYPRVRQSVSRFLAQSLQPWGKDEFLIFGAWGGARTQILGPRNVFALRYAYPDDPAIALVARNMGPGTPASITAGPVLAAIYATKDILPEDPAQIPNAMKDVPLTYVDPQLAMFAAKSGWDTDAVAVQCRVKSLQQGHNCDGFGMFALSAVGRVWSLYPNSRRGATTGAELSTVLIDGKAAGPYPGSMVDYSDQPGVSWAAFDLKRSWDKTPELRKSADTLPDPSTPNDWIGMNDWKLTEPGANKPWSEHPHYANLATKNGPRFLRSYLPVQYAFRTVGLVQGEQPYVLVMDDLKQDDTNRLYTWQMITENDVVLEQQSGPNAVVLGEKNGTRKLAIYAFDSANPDTPLEFRMEPVQVSWAADHGTRLVVSSKAKGIRLKVVLRAFDAAKGEDGFAARMDGKDLVVQRKTGVVTHRFRVEASGQSVMETQMDTGTNGSLSK